MFYETVYYSPLELSFNNIWLFHNKEKNSDAQKLTTISNQEQRFNFYNLRIYKLVFLKNERVTKFQVNLKLFTNLNQTVYPNKHDKNVPRSN